MARAATEGAVSERDAARSERDTARAEAAAARAEARDARQEMLARASQPPREASTEWTGDAPAPLRGSGVGGALMGAVTAATQQGELASVKKSLATSDRKHQARPRPSSEGAVAGPHLHRARALPQDHPPPPLPLKHPPPSPSPSRNPHPLQLSQALLSQHATLSREYERLQAHVKPLTRLTREHEALRERHEAALELLGEKEEELDALRAEHGT